MKIRIHETGPDGRPVSCTGDVFAGATAQAIVEGMMINPFTQDADSLAYMGRVLASIGLEGTALPADPAEAAEAFLSILVAAGYAAFEQEENSETKEKQA